jgi:PiT family inorganic phosphate transporter
MRKCFYIPDELIAKLKYVLLGIFIISMIAYSYFFKWADSNVFLLLATIFAIYMAINLWANDVANNMGPAVWAKAISLTWAIIIAMIFEAAWAIIAWGDVVNTIKWWIIDPNHFQKWSIEFIAIMLATLLGSALWVNIATFFKAPVSITHSILGWLIWAWITAAWFEIVNWPVVIKVMIALIIAIFMWWIISTLIYISIRKTILKQKDKWEAAKHWVPIYIALMTLVFSLYLILKSLKLYR